LKFSIPSNAMPSPYVSSKLFSLNIDVISFRIDLNCGHVAYVCTNKYFRSS
jgi:hypothetical protein